MLFSNNKLTTVDAQGFGNVPSLKFYDISFNAFTGPIPDALLMPAWLPGTFHPLARPEPPKIHVLDSPFCWWDW